MKVRRIGTLAYDGVQALDVAGPADVVTTANHVRQHKVAPYDVLLVGMHKGAVRTESGLAYHVTETLPDAGLLDTIIVPGGSSLRLEPKTRTAAANWLRDRARLARRVVSVCTGIYALAESGLLDGRSVTTHWRFARDVAERWKAVHVDADAIFVKDGKFYTSAGITAGIDLALALVEEDH